jgi:Na+/proline symporter
MTETKSHPANRFWGNTDSVLRLVTVVFIVALLVHGADHLRRGMHAFSATVMVAGSVQIVLALLTAVLVIRGNRWAAVAAVVVGFASAVGFIIVHLLPDWFGPFSDSFIHAPPASRVTGFSWFAAIFEIIADIAVGIAGLRVLRSRRPMTLDREHVR